MTHPLLIPCLSLAHPLLFDTTLSRAEKETIILKNHTNEKRLLSQAPSSLFHYLIETTVLSTEVIEANHVVLYTQRVE